MARGPFLPLGNVRQAGGKIVHAWAAAGGVDPEAIVRSITRVEWLPRSGRFETFPAVDRADWFDLERAAGKRHRAQAEFLTRLVEGVQDET